MIMIRRKDKAYSSFYDVDRATKDDEGVIVQIYFNNPPVNTLSKKFIKELSDCIDEISNSDSVHMVIFAKDSDSDIKHFSAGADLKERALMTDDETLNFISEIRSCFDKIENLKVPTVAWIKGACLGGGLELALCCDFRYCDKSAIFGLPETTLGIIPGAGGTYRLPKIVGIRHAKHIIYTGKKFDSSIAKEYCLVDGIVGKLKLDIIVDLADILNKIETFPYRNDAISAAVKAINFGINNSKKDSMKFELEQYKTTLSSPERIEALKKYEKNNK